MACGASRALWLLGRSNGVAKGSSVAWCGDGAGDRTVVSHQADLALGEEAGARLVPVCSCRALSGNDGLEWAVMSIGADQTVVLGDSINTRSVGSRCARGGGSSRDSTVLSYWARETIDERGSSGGVPIGSSRAVYWVDGALNTVIAGVTWVAVCGLAGASCTPVSSSRTLGRRDSGNGAVVPHRADKALG